jgi:hypothetical protein
LKLEKENVTAGCLRHSEKHKRFGEKIEQEKVEIVEAHATALVGVKDELAKETQDYMDYW